MVLYIWYVILNNQFQLFISVYYQLIFQVFNGNSGKDDIVKHSLKEYASARFIRFHPTTFKSHKALRVEVFGILISAGTFFIIQLHFAEYK